MWQGRSLKAVLYVDHATSRAGSVFFIEREACSSKRAAPCDNVSHDSDLQ
jgi:hypothetical protein